MTCRSGGVHHAYHENDGFVPCCGIHFIDVLQSGETETTDPARVTCNPRSNR